jgi:hypothetical protein
MPDVLSTEDVKEILDKNPEAEFSLQRIRVEFSDGTGHMIAGYHILAGHLPKMIHVKGSQIWDYIAY